MKKDSLKVNFVFQITYQLLMLFVPLIIAPYLTRTLGSNNLGIYAYVHSIAYYFVLFAMLGISKYGQRLIAQCKEGSEHQRREFWSLLAVHVFFSILSIILYLGFIVVCVRENKEIFWFDIFYVISALFDITWLFYGLENFRTVVYRNILVKVMECVFIFLFVKTIEDLSIYVLICSASLLLGQVALIPVILKIIPPIHFSLDDALKHLKPLFVLTIAVLAISLYTIFDKTLLGIFANKSYVAFYEYSDRLVKIPLTFIAVVGTVMLPRACKMVANKDSSNSQKFYVISSWFTSIISSLTFWCLLIVGEDLAVGYLGEEFKPCGQTMLLMSPIVLIVGIGDIVRSQFLIPYGRDKLYTISICISALLNILISLLLLIHLPDQLKIIGVIIGTFFAETFGTAFQFFACRDIISFKKVIPPVLISFVIGAMMAGVVFSVKLFLPKALVFTLLLVLLAICVYLAILSIYAIFVKDLKHIIFNIIRK